MAAKTEAEAGNEILARWAIDNGVLRIGPDVDGAVIPRSPIVRMASFSENASSSSEMSSLRPVFEDKDDHSMYWWAKRDEIVKVSIEGPVSPGGSLAYWFAGLPNLVRADGLEKLDTSGVESAKGMFFACKSLKTIDALSLDMRNIIDASEMFANCTDLSEAVIEHFGGPRLQDASSMFSGCTALEKVRIVGRGLRSLSRAEYMFYKCKKLNRVMLLGFRNARISSAFSMFSGCVSLDSVKLAEIRFSEDANLRKMFSRCRSLTKVSMALPAGVADMEDMFAGCRKMISFDNLPDSTYGSGDDYDQDDDLKSELISDTWALLDEIQDLNADFESERISAEQFLDLAAGLMDEDGLSLLEGETRGLDLEEATAFVDEALRFSANIEAASAVVEAHEAEDSASDAERMRGEQDAQTVPNLQKPIAPIGLIDYNKRYRDEGTTLFRDEVIRQTLAVLIGKDKPNALLVGPAGTGKTKIVEDIACRLANHDSTIPNALRDFTIYELSLFRMVGSGTGLVGDLERSVEKAINFAKEPANKAILFIDEIHMLCGSSKSYGDVAQIIKPYLARGDIRVIGATTLQEARRLADDPAFNRRFSRITVDELTREQTVEVLKQARPAILAHYGCGTVTDGALEFVVDTADMTSGVGSHRPDNALTLLDRAVGEAIVARS